MTSSRPENREAYWHEVAIKLGAEFDLIYRALVTAAPIVCQQMCTPVTEGARNRWPHSAICKQIHEALKTRETEDAN